MTDMISLASPIDGFEFQALHREAQGRRRGGVVLVQEIFGLDDYMKADAERWSKLGFEVLAPSMFDRRKPGFVAAHDEAGMQEGVLYMTAIGFEKPVSDVQACVDRLKSAGPVFMAGYCYGGLVTWLAAAKVEGLAAGSSYYGRLADHAALTPKCPVICHFGRKDGHIPADATRDALVAAHPELAVYIYENSGHGFNNDGAHDADPADAELGRRRTLALFEANGAT